MENNSSNYDMFDKLIANNKKAQSWTIFWVITLCLLAAAVLWMAFAVSEKNKTILDNYKTIYNQKLALQSQQEFLETKNPLLRNQLPPAQQYLYQQRLQACKYGSGKDLGK